VSQAEPFAFEGIGTELWSQVCLALTDGASGAWRPRRRSTRCSSPRSAGTDVAVNAQPAAPQSTGVEAGETGSW